MCGFKCNVRVRMHVSGTIIQALGTATQNLPTWRCYSLYGCMHDVNLVHTILLFKFSTTLRPLTAMPGCPMYPACWRLSLRRSSMQLLATTRLHLMQSSLWLPLMTPFQVFDGVKVKLGFIILYWTTLLCFNAMPPKHVDRPRQRRKFGGGSARAQQTSTAPPAGGGPAEPAAGGGRTSEKPPNVVVTNTLFLITTFLQLLAYIACCTWWSGGHLST